MLTTRVEADYSVHLMYGVGREVFHHRQQAYDTYKKKISKAIWLYQSLIRLLQTKDSKNFGTFYGIEQHKRNLRGKFGKDFEGDTS